MGPTKGGTKVTILGDKFRTDKKIICNFDDIPTRGKVVGNN